MKPEQPRETTAVIQSDVNWIRNNEEWRSARMPVADVACEKCGDRYLLVHVEPPCDAQTICMRCEHPFPWHRLAVYCDSCASDSNTQA